METDFENESVAEVPARSAVDFDRPLFVNRLGVIGYLTKAQSSRH